MTKSTLLFTLATMAMLSHPTESRAAGGEDAPVVIKANLVSKNGSANGAIASISLDASGNYSLLASMSYFKDNVAGYWRDGAYYFTQFEELWGTIYANFDSYSTASWERLSHINSGLTWADCPTDLTFSQGDATVYGCFHNAAHNAFVLGTLDQTTGKSTPLADLPQQMVGVASHTGKVYTIGADGTLYRYTTAEGLVTVGTTGVTADAAKRQSATTDPATGLIYWAAQLTGNKSALYTIDPTTATATKVFDFTAREVWVGLQIDGQEQTVEPGPGTDIDDPEPPIVHENSYVEDFELCDGNYYHEWLPQGWEDRSQAGHVGNNPDNWMSQQNLTWQVGSISDGTGHPAYEGNYCAFINVSTAWGNQANERQDEWLITPSVKVQQGEWLYFQLSYSPGWTLWDRTVGDYTGRNNVLEVHVSEDGGTTWEYLWDCTQLASALSVEELEADRSSLAHPYVPVYVDLRDRAGKEVRLAFRYVGIGGQSMSIDLVTVGLPIPKARYTLPDGVYREALSYEMTAPDTPLLWAPAEREMEWKHAAEHPQQFFWTYDGGEADTPNLITPGYAQGETVNVPSLKVSFGENVSNLYTDDFRQMQIEGQLTDRDEEGVERTFGIGNYNWADPTAYPGFNRTFGFDDNSLDKWCGLAGRPYGAIVPSCAVSAYSAPLKPYVINEIYVNVKAEKLNPERDITCDIWTVDETGAYITEIIGNAHLKGSQVTSLYPNDEQNSSWSVMKFDFSENPIYVDRKIYVMVGGFSVEEDAVYFPGISTANPYNTAESYFGVVDYTEDPEGIFKMFDVNSYNLGTGGRHLAGFLFGLMASYDIPQGIDGVIATPATTDDNLYDLAGRRLMERPTTGVYIQGGKKHVVK